MSYSDSSEGESSESEANFVPFKRRKTEGGDSAASMNSGSMRSMMMNMNSFVSGGTESLGGYEREEDDGETAKPQRTSDEIPSSQHTERYGIGAKLMAQMGYKTGKGLGAEGKGIVQPIEQKLRPSLLGLGGMDENTRQSQLRRKEASKKKKNSEELGSEGDEGNKGNRKSQTPAPKNVYKTMEEMETEGLHIPSGFKHIIDMTSEGGRVIENMDDSVIVRSGATTPDTLSLFDKARGEIEKFSKDWRILQQRKQHTKTQYENLEGEMDTLLLKIGRLKSVIEVVEKINNTEKDDEGRLIELLDKLQIEHFDELNQYNLDRVAVSVLYPMLEKHLANWDPIENPTLFRDVFIKFRVLLQSTDSTLFSTMMYRLWLPKVRSFLSTNWNVEHPTSIILLLEEWENTLPKLIRNQLLTQAILPKLKQGIEQWKPRKQPYSTTATSPPHAWLFPWLPYLPENSRSEVIDQVKLKFSTLLSSWRPSKGSPIDGLESWIELFGTEDMENLLVSHLLPRLGDYLRKEFMVNPADQNMEPLEHVIKWGKFVRPSTLGVIFEEQFFPKWIDVLYQWLVSPQCNPSEISIWFRSWQEWFPNDIQEIPAVKHGFRRGLDLINAALDVDASERSKKLQNPVKDSKLSSSRKGVENLKISEKPSASTGKSVASTFREVVEDFCTNNDLFLISLKKAHQSLGHALFKISPSPTGHGGIMCYFDDDVLWVQSAENRSEYEPISLNELSSRMSLE